jgi:hypothetical protein
MQQNYGEKLADPKILLAGNHVIKPEDPSLDRPKSFAQSNDLMKQRVTTYTTARLVEMGFRFFRGILRGPEGERKLPTGSDYGKCPLPIEPSGMISPPLRCVKTPR